MSKTKRNDIRSLICATCTIGLLLLFGVGISLIVGGLVIAAVAYAVFGLAIQHRHRPRARIRR